MAAIWDMLTEDICFSQVKMITVNTADREDMIQGLMVQPLILCVYISNSSASAI